MPRAERALEGDDELTAFAAELRALRQKAGSPPYRKLASIAHYSATTLADAAGGQRLPSLAVVLAYVRACNGDAAEWEARWHALAAALAADGASEDRQSGGDASSGDDASCPYVGLAAFAPTEAGWFFGRERLADELALSTRSQRFTVVSGPSGSGKSSLLRAGLLPRLDQAGAAGASGPPVVLLTPGPHPLDQCAIRLAGFGAESASVLHRELRADPRALHLAVCQALDARGEPESAELVLVVDQFEEVFTLCADGRERAAFISALLTAAGESNSRIRVVLGIRADFLGHCAQYPELVEALRDAQVAVAPMSTDELRRAVSMPAAAEGCTVEGALLARVVADAVGQPNALPLVSHSLRETWRRRRGNTLTLAGYEASGGIHYALARTAEALYENLTDGQRALARGILLRLVALGDGTEDTKRRLARDELAVDAVNDTAADVRPVLETLAGARLITLDAEGVELTHEALLHAWPRLRGWINEDRVSLLIRQQLSEAATAWEREGRDQSALYRGDRLAAARDMAERTRDTPLGPRARQFLAASRRQERRVTRLRRTALVAISTLALVATAFAGVAFQQQSKAQSERNDAIAGEVLAEAEQLQSTDPSLAAQLTLASYQLDPTGDGYTDLLNTENIALSSVLTGHAGAVYTVAYSPNGRVLATGSADGTVRLWHTGDAADPSLWTAPINMHAGKVYWLAYSPDGRTLAVADADGTVQLWNVTDPAHPVLWRTPLTGHAGHVFSVSFSADGKVLASAGVDHTVRLWNVAEPADATPIGSPIVEPDDVASANFSPVGRTLTIAGHDGTVRLLDVSDPAHPTALGTPLTWDGDVVYSATFSPDGKFLAAASGDHTVRLWDVSDPAHPVVLGTPLTGHNDIVYGLAFSPDGKILATASADQTVRLWNLSDPADPVEIGQPLVGHTSFVYWLAFSPDGRTLASVSADGTARLWNIPTTVLISGAHYVNVAFSPNGRLLAGVTTQTVALWNVANPAEPVLDARLPVEDTKRIVWSEFSPDGRTLITTGRDGTARLWNVTDPAHPVAWGPPLLPGGGTVDMAVFSPDGRFLATGSADGTVRLWNVANPAQATAVGKPLAGLTASLFWIGFSPDGRTLAGTDSSDRLLMWNVAEPARPVVLGHVVNTDTGGVEQGAFSSDGKVLATADIDYTVRLWNVADPASVTSVGAALTGHTSWVYWVGYSPDGKTLASTGADGTVRLWNVAEPTRASELGRPLTDHTAAIDDAAFSPNGQVLATASDDSTMELTLLGVGQAAAHVCAASANTLTAAAWSRYVPDLPYNPPCGG